MFKVGIEREFPYIPIFDATCANPINILPELALAVNCPVFGKMYVPGGTEIVVLDTDKILL